MTDINDEKPNNTETRNHPDWGALWAEADKQKKERQDKDAYYASLSPQQLADDLYARCNLHEGDTIETLEKRLLETSLILDRAFTRSMHDAGLGREGRLQLDGLQHAMQAQRLMRQTYQALKPDASAAPTSKSGEQTKGHEKHEQ